MRRSMLLAEVIDKVMSDSDADILTSDFQATRNDGFCRILIHNAWGTPAVYSLVPSSGSSIALNGGADIGANTKYSTDIPLDTGRTWNIQSAEAVTATIRVQEVSLVV